MFRFGPHTLAFSDLFAKASVFLLIPYLTSALSPYEFGQLSLYQGIFQAFLIIAIFSANGLIPIVYAENGTSRALSIRYASMQLVVFSVSALFVLAASSFLVVKPESLDISLIFIVCVLVILHAGSLINLSFYRASKDYGAPTMAQLLLPVVGMLATFIIFELISPSVFGRFFAMVLALIVTNSIYFWVLRKKYGLERGSARLKEVVKYGLGLLPHHLSHWVKSYFDRFVIASFLSVSVAGIYSLSMQLISAFLVFFGVLSQAVQPYVYDCFKSNDIIKLKKIQYCFLAACIAVLSLGTLFLNIYFVYLFPESYLRSLDYFNVLVFGAFFQSVYFFYSHRIFFMRQNKFVSLLGVFSALVHVILVLLLFSFFEDVMYLCYLYSCLNFVYVLLVINKASKLWPFPKVSTVL